MILCLNSWLNVNSTKSLVVGGACIDRCEGDVSKLGINFYFDLLMPINLALRNSMDCAIYVDTPIEVYSNSEGDREKWLKLVEDIETFIFKLSELLDISISVVRRDQGYKIIDKILEKVSFSDEEIKGLYDLVPSSKVQFSEDLLLHFRRSIVAYLPEFLSQYLKKNIENVIVVEELSQCKAISKARGIDSNLFPEIYLDMPSLSCKNRMHRSLHGKVGIFEDAEKKLMDSYFVKFINLIDLEEIFRKLGADKFIALTNKLKGIWNEY